MANTETVTWQEVIDKMRDYLGNRISDEEMLDWAKESRGADQHTQIMLESWVETYNYMPIPESR